jgi:hypothetical protein
VLLFRFLKAVYRKLNARLYSQIDALAKDKQRLAEGMEQLSKGMEQLQRGNTSLQETNEQLQETNEQLQETNEQLHETNIQRRETSARLNKTNTKLEYENEILRTRFEEFGEYEKATVIYEKMPTAASSVSPEHNLPCILFNTLPKSGSVFIVNMLAQGLNTDIDTISYGYFPFDLIDFRKIKEISRGNKITQEHLDASPMNIQILKRFCTRIVLHLRDPRQAMLSWTHHMNRIKREDKNDLLWWVYPTPSEEYYGLSLEKQIDWSIDNYLPICVQWVKSWLHMIKETPCLDVLVTTYEDFIADNNAFIGKILEFYGIPKEAFCAPTIDKTLLVNYRKGDPNEWREEFTEDQKKRANQIVSEPLLERFHWG